MFNFFAIIVKTLVKVVVTLKNSHEKLKNLKSSIKSLLLTAAESLDIEDISGNLKKYFLQFRARLTYK